VHDTPGIPAGGAWGSSGPIPFEQGNPMRRVPELGLVFLTLLLFTGCGETHETALVQPQIEEGASIPGSTASEIFDGTSNSQGANPHFFFLSPIAENNPTYSGIQDDALEPVVTVCPFDSWNGALEECAPEDVVAVFSMDASDPDDQISLEPGDKYSVVWQTKDHPATAGTTYRISVDVAGQTLGYADVTAFDQTTYSGHHNTAPGVIAFSDNGSLNITFRIEEGALEAEYCDPENLEDCDVALFTYETGGCLRVFENPGETGEQLGSEVCVPAYAAQLDGGPVQGIYAVILTLEQQNQTQGGNVPLGQQIPYFPDLYTDPPGVTFDPNSTGVQVSICQVDDPAESGYVPESLHPFLRPFIVFANGNTVLPEDYYYGVPECEGFEPHTHTASTDTGDRGFLAVLARGARSVGRLFLPEPLVARRLHGGLNTTVYDTRGDRSDGDSGDAVAPLATGDEPEIAEFGAVLDVDPLSSEATVPAAGQVGAETSITILALDPENNPFPFQVPVEVSVVSGTDIIEGQVTYDGSGQYTATYTPTTVGSDVITITIDGEAMAGSPFQSAIAPRSVDPSGSTVEISYSQVGGETIVTVTVKDTNGDPYVYGDQEVFAIDVEIKVTGANTATVTATDADENGVYDGVYVASYSPADYGDDFIAVTVDGEPVGDSPYTVTTAPRPADPAQSFATWESTADVEDAQVDAPTNVTITILNEAGEPYDYAQIRPIQVEFSVSGANSVPATTLSDPDGDGVYLTSYTPTEPGEDLIRVTLDGEDISGSPYTSVVAPQSGDLIVDLDITGGAPEDGLPVYLYQDDATLYPDLATPPFRTGTTDADGKVTFTDMDFGDYVVHFPKRDFDMDFQFMTLDVTHNQAPNTVTFSALTLPMPEGSRIWRIRAGGIGNGYQYIVDGRSFGASLNQIAAMPALHGAQPHMVDIFSQGENDFVKDFFVLDPSLCPDETNPKKCKYQGWIGLTDEDVEGTYLWVTGLAPTYFNWPEGIEPEDRKGNLDHVEIDLTGTWGIINGASSTNEGYFIEWDVAQTDTPPFQ